MGPQINARALAASLLLAVFAGCGTGENKGRETTGDSLAAMLPAPEQDSVEDSLGVGQEDATIPLVLGRGGRPVETVEPRVYPLRLVNRTEQPAVVYAEAGAGRVVLDTVEALDSARVDVEVRAGEIQLQATDLTGRTLISATVAPSPDSVTRWEVRRERPNRL